MQRYAELRGAAPWNARRFPLEVEARTAHPNGERLAAWEIHAPDPAALLLRVPEKRLEVALAADPLADPAHGIPYVTRTRWGKPSPFRFADELVELAALFEVAARVATGEEGLVVAEVRFAGAQAAATSFLPALWKRRATG